MVSVPDQVQLLEDRLHPGAVFHRKTDVDPLVFQVCDKDFITPVAAVICRKPGLDVAGAMQPPFAVPDGWLTDGNTGDISQADSFGGMPRKVVVSKDDFACGYGNQAIVVGWVVGHGCLTYKNSCHKVHRGLRGKTGGYSKQPDSFLVKRLKQITCL